MKNYPARLSAIPLRKGSRPKVDALIAFMKENASLYEDEAGQKNYWWDAVFYEEKEDRDLLWIVCKSPDWLTIKYDDDIKRTAFRDYYNHFKKECWLQEKVGAGDWLDSIWEPEWNLPRSNN